MVKIYTRTGDSGETSLFDGQRVTKSSMRVSAYGDVDELNSSIGLAASFTKDEQLREVLQEIQVKLFEVGADLATPLESITPKPITRIAAQDAKRLEKIIDEIDAKLEPMTNFILPGGSQCAASLHLARSICRRAERSVISLKEKETINFHAVTYLNRLSDLLFVLTRYANKIEKIKEEKWIT